MPGPGAADLLTVRAVRLLAKADIVFHDALVEPDVLALAPRAEKIAVGKRCGAHSTSQRFINKRLVDAAARHAVVVRLKGGDPMLFGRAQEEIDALAAAGVDVEVVPGVTAALAAAADLNVSLTRRGVARSVAMVTPRVGEGESPHAWARAAANADTAVIYMGAGQADAIVAALTAHGTESGYAGRARRKRMPCLPSRMRPERSPISRISPAGAVTVRPSSSSAKSAARSRCRRHQPSPS